MAIAYPDLVTAQNRDGLTPVEWALTTKHVDLVKVLIDHGVDVMLEGEYVLQDDYVLRTYSPSFMRLYNLCNDLEKRAIIVKYALWHTQLSFKIVISLMKKKDTPHICFRCEDMNCNIISFL